jgi:PAS domain S-box-containing protein
MGKVDLERIVEILPCHIYWKDTKGVFLGCNENNWKDFGLSSLSEFIGKTDYDLFPKEIADRLSVIDNEVIRTNKLIVAEEEAVKPDGSLSLYLSHKVPLVDKSKNILGILGVSVDITQARKDEIEHLEILENIIAIMPGHVYWVNRDNVYVGCNDNQAKSAGLNSRKEIIGKRNEDLPWNEKSKILPVELDNINTLVMDTGNSIVVEEPATLQDGTQITFLSSKVPMRNGENKIIGMVGISIDITDKKEAERLRIEKKAAEERAETIKLLSAAMAHELRTPLRGIESGTSGLATYLPRLIEGYEMAKKAGLDVPYVSPMHYQSLSKVVDNIQLEARAAFSVIDMLLIKASLAEVDVQAFQDHSIADCVEQALERYPFRQDERKMIHWQTGDFHFHGDDMLMIHVIFNLIKNALHYVKAANKGNIEIWCDEDKKFNILYFKDTGQGIAPDILPHIFERFYTRTKHGTGVGLAFCQLVMQSMGGDIVCDSVQGEYTQFTLYFPK